MSNITKNDLPKSRRSLLLTAGAVAVLALSFGGVAAAVGSSGHKEKSTPPTVTYEVNERGMTYGSALGAPTPESEPDLIEAIGEGGQAGYVRSSDLAGEHFSSPKEALETHRKAQPTSIPLYAADGVTVVGKFTVAVPFGTVNKENPEAG